MRIGIIGAGHIGGTLAEHFARVGHAVAISNSRGPDTLRDLVTQLGERAQAIATHVLSSDVFKTNAWNWFYLGTGVLLWVLALLELWDPLDSDSGEADSNPSHQRTSFWIPRSMEPAAAERFARNRPRQRLDLAKGEPRGTPAAS